MASRAQEKARARAQRVEFERKLAETEQRKQRLMRLAGMGLVAVIVIVAAIVISSGASATKPLKPTSAAAKVQIARVSSLLSGIPETGTTLGNPNAPIQVTEYGDLECSACDYFALPTTMNTSAGISGSGLEDQLINTYVKTGRASLVYRSLDTATHGGATPNEFTPQQAAALAAGLQGKAWYYIELFYAEQGAEGSTYVTGAYLDGLAKQVPGLNYSKWLADRSNPSLAAQVKDDSATASAQSLLNTPSLLFRGPKGEAVPIQGAPSAWSEIQAAINSVGG